MFNDKPPRSAAGVSSLSEASRIIISISSVSPYPLVQGVRVTFVTMCTGVDRYPPGPHLCSYDLSRRGWRTLPLRDEGDGTERRTSFEDKRIILLQGDQGMADIWRTSTLGDGRFIRLVSRFCRWEGLGVLMSG